MPIYKFSLHLTTFVLVFTLYTKENEINGAIQMRKFIRTYIVDGVIHNKILFLALKMSRKMSKKIRRENK